MAPNDKNLQYEANEPAFLRRLRSENAFGDSSRQGRAQVRPRKPTQDGEENDQPAYVMEDSQDVLSKTEYEALMTQTQRDGESRVSANTPSKEDHDSAKTAPAVEENDSLTDNLPSMKQAMATIGTSNKRRLAKIIVDNDDDDVALKSKEKDSERQPKKPDIKKPKKAKKVKLSFD